ncbi:hypothetical protein [Streptomyces sp. TRM68367]|uniref:hypothetical protein n=1 Tax=Streptomyces sp. TRM68367 TaxID=2758415 RepID=UPI00165B237A|nr:hypothetical protein [Streptomyces sp. TRM68367]MBC9725595.1 hypothetical protein [Streptomyces sp. TRM68367]
MLRNRRHTGDTRPSRLSALGSAGRHSRPGLRSSRGTGRGRLRNRGRTSDTRLSAIGPSRVLSRERLCTNRLSGLRVSRSAGPHGRRRTSTIRLSSLSVPRPGSPRSRRRARATRLRCLRAPGTGLGDSSRHRGPGDSPLPAVRGTAAHRNLPALDGVCLRSSLGAGGLPGLLPLGHRTTLRGVTGDRVLPTLRDLRVGPTVLRGHRGVGPSRLRSQPGPGIRTVGSHARTRLRALRPGPGRLRRHPGDDRLGRAHRLGCGGVRRDNRFRGGRPGVHRWLCRALCAPGRRALLGRLVRRRYVEVLGAGRRRSGLPYRRVGRAAVGEGADRAGGDVRDGRAEVQRAARRRRRHSLGGYLGRRLDRRLAGARMADRAEVDGAAVAAGHLVRARLVHGLDDRFRRGRRDLVAPRALRAGQQQQVFVLGGGLGEVGVRAVRGGARLLHHACVLRQPLARDLAGVGHAYPSPIG